MIFKIGEQVNSYNRCLLQSSMNFQHGTSAIGNNPIILNATSFVRELTSQVCIVLDIALMESNAMHPGAAEFGRLF
jgi:delta-aminolevulinic acid dehydratase/porphobilinogen synthase